MIHIKFTLKSPARSNFIFQDILEENSYQKIIAVSDIEGLSKEYYAPLTTGNGLKKQFEQGVFNQRAIITLVCYIFSRYGGDIEEIERRISMLFEEFDFSEGGQPIIKWINKLIADLMNLRKKEGNLEPERTIIMTEDGKILISGKGVDFSSQDETITESDPTKVILPKSNQNNMDNQFQRAPMKKKLITAVVLLVIGVLIWSIFSLLNQSEPNNNTENQTVEKEQPRKSEEPITLPPKEELKPSEGKVDGNQINFGDNNQFENNTISGGDVHQHNYPKSDTSK